MATSDPDQPTPRSREIINAARELLEAAGIETLSMRRVAQQLGIRAPSIYKHLPTNRSGQPSSPPALVFRLKRLAPAPGPHCSIESPLARAAPFLTRAGPERRVAPYPRNARARLDRSNSEYRRHTKSKSFMLAGELPPIRQSRERRVVARRAAATDRPGVALCQERGRRRRRPAPGSRTCLPIA